jgi:hypothetical protein
LSGIGSLTARNLDGRGVRVIITGEKGRGDAELFNSPDLKYESCWNKEVGSWLSSNQVMLRHLSLSILIFTITL